MDAKKFAATMGYGLGCFIVGWQGCLFSAPPQGPSALILAVGALTAASGLFAIIVKMR